MSHAHNVPVAGSISRNPATGALIATYPFQSDAEIEQLLDDNAAAAGIWRAMPIDDRIEAYRRLARVLRDRSDMLAMLITAEMGKTITAARAEVEKCVVTLEWIALHGPAILADEEVPVPGSDHVYVSYLPLGTVLGVMPWNFPLWQVIRAAGPIMLSGNGFVLKHAPNVMGCAYALLDAYRAAGFPQGIFAILHTDNDTVARVIDDRRIAAATVTGSTRAGAAVAALAGRALKKTLLELGGTDAFIVLADADIDGAVQAGIEARFQNAGQVCLAAKRFILEQPIAEAFTQKFVEAARALKSGDPTNPAVRIGPMARADLRDELHDQVARTVRAGATLLLGGEKGLDPGLFYAPTVLANVQPGMAAFEEETFGPVAALTIARDIEHAIALTNDSDYGLSGAIWSRDIDRARRIARRLETGGVFINGYSVSNPHIPVGGVKKSGYGRELSRFGLREFTNAQAVWARSGT